MFKYMYGIYKYLYKVRASLIAQLVKYLPAMQETRFNSWVKKIPWRRKWEPTPAFLPGESHGQRSLAGYSPRGLKELDMTEDISSSSKARDKGRRKIIEDLVSHDENLYFV